MHSLQRLLDSFGLSEHLPLVFHAFCVHADASGCKGELLELQVFLQLLLLLLFLYFLFLIVPHRVESLIDMTSGAYLLDDSVLFFDRPMLLSLTLRQHFRLFTDMRLESPASLLRQLLMLRTASLLLLLSVLLTKSCKLLPSLLRRCGFLLLVNVATLLFLLFVGICYLDGVQLHQRAANGILGVGVLVIVLYP